MHIEKHRSLLTLRIALEKHPRLCPFVVFSFLAVLCLNRPAQAQSDQERVTEITRLAQQAETDLHHQDSAKAVQAYQEILALDPSNLQAHSNLGLAYYLQGKFTAASEQFEEALHLQPDLWQIEALCGLSENQSGQPKIAKPHLERAFEHVGEPQMRMAVGRQLFSILFEAGELQRASSIISELQELDPDNVDVLYAAHQVYSLLANRAFLSMARLQPDSARMYQLRGDKMLQSGNLAGAITAYREALSRDPHLAGAHFTLGEALNDSPSASDREQAEGEYQKALAENSMDERAECRLGALDLDRSETESASRHYKRALQLQPDDAEANEGMGLVLLTTNSTQEAAAFLKRAVLLDPTNGTAHYHLARASKSLGDMQAANHEMDEYRRLKAQQESLKQGLHELPSTTPTMIRKNPDETAP